LGIALAGPILGAIAQDVGYRNMFGIAASMAAIALVTFVTQSSQTVKQSVRFALGRSVDVYAVKNGL
jgi:L-serine deaminase